MTAVDTSIDSVINRVFGEQDAPEQHAPGGLDDVIGRVFSEPSNVSSRMAGKINAYLPGPLVQPTFYGQGGTSSVPVPGEGMTTDPRGPMRQQNRAGVDRAMAERQAEQEQSRARERGVLGTIGDVAQTSLVQGAAGAEAGWRGLGRALTDPNESIGGYLTGSMYNPVHPEDANTVVGAAGYTAQDRAGMSSLAGAESQQHPVAGFVGQQYGMLPGLADPKALAAMIISHNPTVLAMDSTLVQGSLQTIGEKFGPAVMRATEAELHGAVGVGNFSAAQTAIEGGSRGDVAMSGLKGAGAGLVLAPIMAGAGKVVGRAVDAIRSRASGEVPAGTQMADEPVITANDSRPVEATTPKPTVSEVVDRVFSEDAPQTPHRSPVEATTPRPTEPPPASLDSIVADVLAQPAKPQAPSGFLAAHEMTKAEYEATGQELMHGTSKVFDKIETGQKTRYGDSPFRQPTDKVYFTDKPEVARGFANSSGFRQVSLDQYLETFDGEHEPTVADLHADLDRSIAKGQKLAYINDDGAIVQVSKGADIPDDIYRDGDVRLYSAGRWPRVVKTPVYGHALDLTGKDIPAWVPEWIKGHGTEKNSYQHEFDKRIVPWMRENNISKLTVQDAYESGFRSVIVLPEHTGLGRTPHRAAVEAAMAEGKTIPARVLADYPDLKPQEPTNGLPAQEVKAQGEPVPAPAQEGQETTPAQEPVADVREKADVLKGGTPPDTTGIKNAISAQDRERLGLPERDTPETRSQTEMYEAGKAKAASDPNAIPNLIQELRDNPERIVSSDTEHGLLLKHKVDLENNLHDLLDRANKAKDAGDVEDEALARKQLAAHRETSKEFTQLMERAGTASARSLSARRMMSAMDYSLSHMEAMSEAAKGSPLNDAELAKIKGLHEELKAKNEALQSALDTAKERAAQAESDRHTAELQKQAAEKDVPPHVRALADRFLARLHAAADGARARIKARSATLKSGLDPTELADYAIVGADHLAKGTVELAKWSAKMVEEFGEKVKPNLKQIYDSAKARFEREVAAETGPVRRAVRKAKAPADALEKLRAKAENGMEKKDSRPYLRKLAIETIRSGVKDPKALIDNLHGKVKGVYPDITPAEVRDILSGHNPARVMKMDPESVKARASIAEARQRYDQINHKFQQANAPAVTKVASGFQKWVRFGALSWPTVIGKLTGAAAIRTISTPMEQGVGYLLSKAMPRLAEMAPREGVGSARVALAAEAKAQARMWTEGVKGSGKMLLNKRTDLELLHGKDKLPPELTEYLGRLHGALKNPTLENEYARSLELRTAHAARNGVDITDPIQQLRLSNESYMDAKRSIFLGDNKVVDAWNRSLATLEAKDKATGKPTASALLAAGIRAEVPIVSVPLNAVHEATQVMTGWLTGPAKAAFAYVKGIDNLKPVEADAIMRLMKKGSIGAALMTIGFFKADKIGGYRQQGEKRSKDEPQPGDIGGVPHLLLHNPYAEAIQFGATVRKVAESRLSKKQDDANGYGTAAMAATVGLLEEVPFIREATTIGKLVDPRQRENIVGASIASKLVPGVVQWIARQTDTDVDGPIKRKPKGVVQSIEADIPGLRKNVPELPPQK